MTVTTISTCASIRSEFCPSFPRRAVRRGSCKIPKRNRFEPLSSDASPTASRYGAPWGRERTIHGWTANRGGDKEALKTIAATCGGRGEDSVRRRHDGAEQLDSVHSGARGRQCERDPSAARPHGRGRSATRAPAARAAVALLRRRRRSAAYGCLRGTLVAARPLGRRPHADMDRPTEDGRTGRGVGAVWCSIRSST